MRQPPEHPRALLWTHSNRSRFTGEAKTPAHDITVTQQIGQELIALKRFSKDKLEKNSMELALS